MLTPVTASLGASPPSDKASGQPIVGRPLMILLEASYWDSITTSGMAVI